MLVLISNVEIMVHGMIVFLGHHQSKIPNLIQDTNYMVGRGKTLQYDFFIWEHLSIAHVVNIDLYRSDEFPHHCSIKK